MPNATRSIIVYGPQGSGKTYYAPVLMKYFGLTKLIDNCVPGDRIPSTGALILTIFQPHEFSRMTQKTNRMYCIQDLKRELGLNFRGKLQ